jgi:glyoxylase-like metal-dependent hydrolase (beta-lactamase superfamily II)
MKKKILLGVVLVILTPVVCMGVALWLTLRGLAPVPEHGKALVGDAQLINDGFAAIYLLPSSGGASLVDCGDDAKGAAILEELKKRSLGPDDVKAIFLTHGHPDHIASCHLFTKAEVYAFAGDVDIAAGKARSRGFLPRMFDTPEEKRIKVTQTLTDGQVVTVGDRQVLAFAVPGHTTGSAVFLSNGLLMMGDNAQVEVEGALRPAMKLFSDDPELNAKSLQELAAKLKQRGDKVEMTAYGHSAPSEGMKALEGFKPQ